jgi:hypothetical protein
MAHVSFAEHLRHHETLDQYDVPETCTVYDTLMRVFSSCPDLRHQILDEQGGLRRSLVVFLDDRLLHDPRLRDAVVDASRITVLPALMCNES